MPNRFSKLYINYYYGSKIKLNERWGEKNAICPYSKVYYIVGGECIVEVGGRRYHACAGDFFLIPSGVPHSFYHINENYIQKYWFHFDAEAEGTSLFELINPPFYLHIDDGRAFVKLFRAIFKCAADDAPDSQLLLNAKILELLSLYFKLTNTSFSETAVDENTIIRVIVEYVNAHLDKNITLRELAEVAHFHPNYFVRFFKEHIGIPPTKYVNNIKIEYAKSMLENTDLSIKEIMTSIGFDDYSHFSKFFKTYSGYSPSAFRSFYSKL